MKTKCLILDDEPLARDLIFRHAQKFDSLEIVAQCASAEEAAELLREVPVDLIFLDVELPQASGIEFIKSLHHPPKVIVTTAHSEYAMEGFELDAVDYLLKPVRFNRFMRAVNKFLQLNSSFQADFKAGRPFIFVRENKREVKIQLCDIFYIEGLGEYIQIHTKKKKVITKMGMNQMAAKLPPQFFLRIHKSYLICAMHVDAYTSNSLEIAGVELPIGRRYKSGVIEMLNYAGSLSGV
ncbi:LytR/AlgR family response regulator transcription factor [Sunxiuqinia sp. sy24]|uniref:LytR/AlgR family response regulator transcription factor n=1 Tax=Sunxiuqinia sp. sy24 TaxID=3461495 RepID=UPI00404570D6